MNLNNLKSFVKKISGFNDLSHSLKILFFGYYLQHEESISSFNVAEINECYELLDLPQPTNMPFRLKRLKQYAKLVPSGKNYRISGPMADKLQNIISINHKESQSDSMKKSTKPGFDGNLGTIYKQYEKKLSEVELDFVTGLIETGKSNKLKDGLFYVVFVDLSGSTIASSKMNHDDYSNWLKKFIQITKNALEIKLKNYSAFVKSAGDGVLMLFRNFDDILDWAKKVDELCLMHNEECSKAKPVFHQYHFKTIIHLGEVYFDSEDYDTRAFVVNVVFKIEKKFEKGDIGITEAVRQVILPDINSGKFNVKRVTDFSLDGGIVIPLWKLV